MAKSFVLLFFTLLFSFSAHCQLKPGFDVQESMELIKVNFRFVDSARYAEFAAPQRFQRQYRSAVVGLDNCWDFWKDGQGVGVISIRGTTSSMTSWSSNFYSAMVPATGWMKISEKDTFRYELAQDPQAAVHVGWLLSTGTLMKDMLPQLDAFVAGGGRDLYITGHSQGGAIAYLVTAHLWSLRRQGKLPADLRIKTYCSAAPKPGNLHFAYAYEAMTYPGWAYNAVNAADWVPETPFSIQTVNDFNATNPFSDAKDQMKSVPVMARLVLKHAYNKMDRPTKRSQREFEKYLGRKLNKLIRKSVPGFEAPTYLHENAYVRCGIFVPLMPDKGYYDRFPNYTPDNKFTHHMIEPYLYLMGNMDE